VGSDMCGWVDGTKVSERRVAFLFNMQPEIICETLLRTYQSIRRHFQYESKFQE